MLFDELERINSRPRPFGSCTTRELWTDEHTSKRMLDYHLDPGIDAASRKHAFIDLSTDWIVSRFGLAPGSRVADFGCGPGLYAVRLARRGLKVTGIDFSERSIRYAMAQAGKEGLDIYYRLEDYLGFDTPERFDLIIMIMCDFCVLDPAQRGAMLGKFRSLLRPGGHILFDVYSPAGFKARRETATYGAGLLEGFWSPEKYYGFLNVLKYEEEQVVLDKYTIVEAGRTRTIYNWLQYYSPGSIGALLSDNGFRVTDLYGDVAGKKFDPDESEFAVVAEAA